MSSLVSLTNFKDSFREMSFLLLGCRTKHLPLSLNEDVLKTQIIQQSYSLCLLVESPRRSGLKFTVCVWSLHVSSLSPKAHTWG